MDGEGESEGEEGKNGSETAERFAEVPRYHARDDGNNRCEYPAKPRADFE